MRILVRSRYGKLRDVRLSVRSRRFLIWSVVGLLGLVALPTLSRSPNPANAHQVLARAQAAQAREASLRRDLAQARARLSENAHDVETMRRDLLRAAAAYHVRLPQLAKGPGVGTSLGAEADALPKILAAATAQAEYLIHMPGYLPVFGPITSGFGWRANPFGGDGKEFHEGVDIGVPYGTPIRAPGDGVVTYAGWYSGYGNYIMINHGYGVVTTYGHLSRISVHVGESVTRGQPLGFTGDSGYSTGAHLDFGVHENGVPVDPLTFLAHVDRMMRP